MRCGKYCVADPAGKLQRGKLHANLGGCCSVLGFAKILELSFRSVSICMCAACVGSDGFSLQL